MARVGKPRCKDCEAEGRVNRRPVVKAGRCATHNRARRAATKRAAHDRRLRQVYGIDRTTFDALLEAQGGVCAICQRARGISKQLSVDHDHAQAVLDGHEPDKGCRNCVRGLLCGTCNKMLGHLRDDPTAFERAAQYLSDWPSRSARPAGAMGESPAPRARTATRSAAGAGASEK